MKSLSVRHGRLAGEYRFVCMDTGKFKVKHTYNESLKDRLYRAIHKDQIEYFPDPSGGGYFLIQVNFENAKRLIKFGVENAYKIKPDFLQVAQSLTELQRSQVHAQTHRDAHPPEARGGAQGVVPAGGGPQVPAT